MKKGQRLSALYECFNEISDPNELISAVEKICATFELKHASFLGVGLPKVSNGGPLVFSTYQQEWAEVYRAQNFVLIDPVVLHGMQSVVPIDWRHLKTENAVVFETAKEFGVGNQGMTMPIRGPMGECALFSVTTVEEDKHWNLFIDEYQSEINLVAFHLHELILRISGITDTKPRLAPREIEVLKWLANGKTGQDVADILNISNNTVRHYAELSRTKLKALNAAHACARALSMGLIPPPD